MCYPSFLTNSPLSAWSSLFQYKSVAIMPETWLDNAGLLMKKILLKICIYATIICVLVSVFAAPAFATGDVVQFTEAAKLGATVIDLYGMANNTSLAYDVASNGSALTVIENLYQDYATNASDPYTLAAIGAALAAAGAVAVVYDAVTGQGYIQLYQEQYISSMDGYWDYQLSDVGLVRDSLSGLFSWTLNQQDSVSPIVVSSSFSYSLGGISLIPVSVNQEILANIDTGLNYKINSFSSNSPVYYYTILNSNTNVNIFVFVCEDSNQVISYSSIRPGSSTTRRTMTFQHNNLLYTDSSNNSVNFDPIVYYGLDSGNTLITYNNNAVSIQPPYAYNVTRNSPNPIPTGIVTSDSITSDSESVSIHPTGDPLTQPLEITIPDNNSPDYVPVPRRITTNIPWDPTWGDPLPDGVSEPEYGVPYPITDPALLNTVVPEIWDDIVANDVQIQPDPTPSDPDSPIEEVMVPFLPLEIPSFNFSLSGIWHYVVTWVQSLGSWFTAMFAMWSCLPYAMVVPVYATLVVVIVLGLYKRFIA